MGDVGVNVDASQVPIASWHLQLFINSPIRNWTTSNYHHRRHGRQSCPIRSLESCNRVRVAEPAAGPQRRGIGE